MKKLLHITEAMAGGVLVFLADLNRHLKGKYEIVIAYGMRSNTPEDLREYFDEEIKLIPLYELTNHMNPQKMFSGWKTIRQIIRQEKADVIHFHSSAAGILGRMGQRYYGADVYYTPHSYYFQNPEIPRLKSLLFYGIEKCLAYSPSVTVACGKGEYELAGKLSHRCKCIENGIDVERLDSFILQHAVQEKKQQPPAIYASGRICQHKNPFLFNEIAKALPEFRFIWIGDGEEKAVLTSSNIEVTGHISHLQAIKKAMECEMFLLTSTYEGLPLSLLEAMYLKKIVIVNRIDGIKGLITDKENGYICNSKEEMAEAIRLAFMDEKKDEIQNVLCNAKQTVVTRFTADGMAEKYRELYEKIDGGSI